MGQKFFALTSAARRVAFECDFDLSFAASRDKSPRLLSKRVAKTERERGRWEHKLFFNFDLHLRFHFRCTSAKQAREQQFHQSPLGAHLSPIIGFLPATFSLFTLSLTLFAASWRRAQAHFEVYEAAAAAMAAAARGI